MLPPPGFFLNSVDFVHARVSGTFDFANRDTSRNTPRLRHGMFTSLDDDLGIRLVRRNCLRKARLLVPILVRKRGHFYIAIENEYGIEVRHRRPGILLFFRVISIAGQEQPTR
jgi:hypothetical protein